MNNINLVDFLGPAEIDAIKHQGHGCRQKEFMDSISGEEKKARLEASFHSPEAKAKSEAATKVRSWEQRRKISNSIGKYFDEAMGTEEFKASYKKRHLPSFRIGGSYIELEEGSWPKVIRVRSGDGSNTKAFWDSPEGDAMRKHLAEVASAKWASKSPKEKEEWLSASFHNPECRVGIGEKISESLKQYYLSLTSEERSERLKAILKGKEGTYSFRPSMTELLFGSRLEGHFPGIWAYNGNRNQGIDVGGSIPDFVRLDGTKEGIEVLGGFNFYHFILDDEEKVKHYRSCGWKCLPLWEDEIMLDDIFSTKFLPSGGLRNEGPEVAA